MLWWAVALLSSLLSQLPQLYNLHTISLTVEKQKSRNTFQSSSPWLPKQNCSLTRFPSFVLFSFWQEKHVVGYSTLVTIQWQEKSDVLEEKPVPLTLCPPQIPPGLAWDRIRASAVTGRRLTAWAWRVACIISGFSSYRAVNTFRLSYKNQSVNAV